MRRTQVMERDGRALPRQLAAMAARQVVYFGLGFLLAGAKLFGLIAPLGISAIVGVPSGGLVATTAGSMLGYLSMGVTADNLRYIAACIIAASISWLGLFRRNASYYPYVASLIAALSLGCTGVLVGVVWDRTPYALLLTLSETLLGTGAAFFLITSVGALAGGKSLSAMKSIEAAASVLLALMVVVGLQRYHPFGLPLSAVFAGALVLTAAWLFKEGGGALMGTAAGLAFLLLPGGGIHYFALFAVAGLVAGVFSPLSRLSVSTAFFLGASVVAAALLKETSPPVIAALLLSAALFLLIPERVLSTFQKNNTVALRREEEQRESLCTRLQTAAAGLERIGGLVTEVSEKLTGARVKTEEQLFDEAVDTVCKNCDRKLLCHERLYDETMTAFHEMQALLRQGEKITKRNMPQFLYVRCKNPDELLAELNNGYRLLAASRSMGHSVEDLRQAVIEQYTALAGFLEELSDRLEETRETDRHLTFKVREFLKNEDVPVRETECTCDAYGRLSLQFTAERFDQKRLPYLAGALGEVCGRRFLPPETHRRDRLITVRLLEEALYSVRYDMKQQTAEQEKFCGDGFETFLLDNGFSVTLLCDGMGRGGMAAVDGKMAAGLMADLMKAGFSPQSAVGFVNAALFLKSEEESTSTVDLLLIDLYTGKATLYKSGAAPTYIKRGDRVIRVDTEALPIGILSPAPFGKTGIQLKAGDVVVMTTDGALPEDDVVEEALRIGTEKQPDALTARLMNTVCSVPGAGKDDITIAAFYLDKA